MTLKINLLLLLALISTTTALENSTNLAQNSTTSPDLLELLEEYIVEESSSALAETPRLFSWAKNDDVGTARKKQKNQMANVAPMFIVPFLIQSAMVPIMLSILKFMLLASFTVGKLALVFALANSLKNSNRNEEPERIMYAHSGHWR